MNHREKKRLARRKRTKVEIIDREYIFKTEFWLNRKQKIEQKVRNTIMNRQKAKKIIKK